MALLTAPEWMSLSGQTVTGSDLAAISAWCEGVSAAAKRALGQAIETATYTSYLDAPHNTPYIFTRQFPLQTITTLHYNALGYGVSANFTSDHLLTAGTDYIIDVDDDVTGYAKRGRIRRLNQNYWGVQYTRSLSMPLTNSPQPVPKAIKIVYAAGHTPVPPDLQMGLALAVSLLYARRKTGAPIVSESWNGRSVSYAGPFTTTAVIHSPDVWAFLKPYGNTLSLA